MKTQKFFWLAMAVTAILTVGFFSSCSKDDPTPDPDPNLPVDESKITGSGLANFAKISDNDVAIVLGATAYINVEQRRNGKTEPKRFELAIKDSIKHVKGEVLVKSLTLGTASTSYDYKSRGTKKDGYFNVLDSIVTINIAYGGDNLVIKPQITWQALKFDDGYSKKDDMEYIKISKITPSDAELTPLGDQVVDGRKYAKSRYQQDITVNVNGGEYTLKIDLTLKEDKGPVSGDGDDIQWSEMLTSGKVVTTDNESITKYESWLKVRQHLANGQHKDVQVTSGELQGYIEGETPADKNIPDLNLTKVASNIEDVSTEFVCDNGEYVKVYKVTRKYTMKYNYFDVVAYVVHMKAVYNDGATTIEFPTLTHKNFQDGYGATTITEGSKYKLEFYISAAFSENMNQLWKTSFNITVQ